MLYDFSGCRSHFIQGHLREFSIRKPNHFLLNVFTALKGTQYCILLDASANIVSLQVYNSDDRKFIFSSPEPKAHR